MVSYNALSIRRKTCFRKTTLLSTVMIWGNFGSNQTPLKCLLGYLASVTGLSTTETMVDGVSTCKKMGEDKQDRGGLLLAFLTFLFTHILPRT